MKELIRNIGYYIYWALPKWNYAVVYGSPDFEDNVMALQAGLNQTGMRKVIVFVSKITADTRSDLGPKTIVVRKDSLMGIFYFIFARYVFFTHRCFMFRFPPNVVSVNVWHGMPIKKIGWMLDGNRGYESKHTVATSDFWEKIIRKSLLPSGQTLVTGLPRNDRLFLAPKNIWQRLGFLPDTKFQKIIAWLPTYRKSITGDIRLDGLESGNVFGVDGISPESLNDFLRQHDAFAIVKPHPMAHFEKTVQLSNLLIIDDAWLQTHEVTLYEMLGQCDTLVSDISSVVVDYLLLNRPIIHLVPDLVQYRSSRGFSIEPVTDYFVGPLATNVGELFDYLAQTLAGKDSHAAQRERILKLFHDHPDANSTGRLLSGLKLYPEAAPVPEKSPAAELSAGLRSSVRPAASSRFAESLLDATHLQTGRQSLTAQFLNNWKLITAGGLWLALAILIHCHWNIHLSFNPLYLAPCVVLAMRLDCRWPVLLATVAAIIPPLLMHFKDPDFLTLPVALANIVMRFFLFQIIVMLVNSVCGRDNILSFVKSSGKISSLLTKFENYRAVILTSGLFLAGVIGLDFATNPQLNLLPLYLLPCMVLTLAVDRRWGTAAALVAAIAGPFTQRFEHDVYYRQIPVELWNTFVRFAIFQTVVWLLDNFHRKNLRNDSHQPEDRPDAPSRSFAGL